MIFGKPQPKERENYIIQKDQLVGKGQYGSVFKCQIKTNPQFKACVKIIQKKDTEEKLIHREIEILNLLKGLINNANIVQVYDIYDIKDESCIEIIMEYCEGQDLSQIMKQKQRHNQWFTIDESIKIIKQIVCGYYSLYEKRIIHRDLKPANILISNILQDDRITQVYKIGDLGMGRIIENMEQANNFTKVGTPAYAAPQLYLENNFSSKVDVYSLGVIFYQLIYQELPIQAGSMNELMDKLGKLKDKPKYCEEKNNQGIEIDVNIRNLIYSMLRFYESDRIGWQDLFSNKIVGKFQQLQKRLSFIEQKPQEYQELYRVKQKQQNVILQLVKALLNKVDVASHVYDMILKQKRQINLSQEQVSQFSILQVLVSGYKHKLMLNIMGLLFDKPLQLIPIIQQFYIKEKPLKSDESISQELGRLKEFSHKQLSQSTLQYREDECKFYNSNKQKMQNLKSVIDLIEEEQSNDFTKFTFPIKDFLKKNMILDESNLQLLYKFEEIESRIDIDVLISQPPISIIELYGI